METEKWLHDDLEPRDREQYRRYSRLEDRDSSSALKEDMNRSGFVKRQSHGNSNFLSDEEEKGFLTRDPVFLENIKQEVESLDADEGSVSHSQSQARSAVLPFLKDPKQETDDFLDSADTTYVHFASLLHDALQGSISFSDLVLKYETLCREVFEMIRVDTLGRVRVTEDHIMRQKAQLIIDEAATWSLVWYRYGKVVGTDLKDVSVIPSTSQQEAVDFVMTDNTAQLCLRILQWLEDMASKGEGWYAGSYLHKSGVWHQTQRKLRKKVGNASLVQHLDFDAPTREQAQIDLEDQKQEQALLEDVWLLIKAGKLKEACELCCSAGQAWRAAILCGNCGLEPSPSIESLCRTGKNRTLQAVELDSGLAYQRRLWKWACYYASEKVAEQYSARYEAAIFASQCSNLKRILPVCSDWESACWAMVKSWLDFQVDLELARLQRSKLEHAREQSSVELYDSLGDVNMEITQGPESWPQQVLDQQPRDLEALFQKLHSNDIVHEAVCRGCKEQHRQFQMDLMSGDIAHLLGLLKLWILPAENDGIDTKLHGHPQMIRFGAHLVLALRYLLPEDVKSAFQEKLQIIGDLILYTYAIFLFSQKHEELVGLYASQLAPYLCVELYVLIMEMRLNESVHVKHKIFCSALEYLPFFPSDNDKGSVSEILDRVLTRSRERGSNIDTVRIDDPVEKYHLMNHKKAIVVQWLCFKPPETIIDSENIRAELLALALQYSNILFREFSLQSLWRITKMPAGAHMLLSFLAEPLKQQNEFLHSLVHHQVSENIQEFEDWREYYACDALYRNWLSVSMELEEVAPSERSSEEKKRETSYASDCFNLMLSLLQRKKNPWLSSVFQMPQEQKTGEWLELNAIAMLRMPDGNYLQPDATICTALISAFFSSSGDSCAARNFSADVSVFPKDPYCVNITLRCLAVGGDGIGICFSEDGGLLASVLASALKGELENFLDGVTVDLFQLDSWFTDNEGSHKGRAHYIVQGLCRRCCIPELILRCMQMRVSLADKHDTQFEWQYVLAELIATPDSEFGYLFSRRQMQEFLHLEREFYIQSMEV